MTGPRIAAVAALLGLTVAAVASAEPPLKRPNAGVRRVPASGSAAAASPSAAAPSPTASTQITCPADMVRVHDFCIDRYEAALVDAKSGRLLTPFYPPRWARARTIRRIWQQERALVGSRAARTMPLPRLPTWQKAVHRFKAVSRPAAVPHGYLNWYDAKRACEAAGKRLCTRDEWTLACRGRYDRKFPYGAEYIRGACNVHRRFHPAATLHGDASSGHHDPRLNLVAGPKGDSGLRAAGATSRCQSEWGSDAIYDMVGNLDEWIADPNGEFRGGFYARMTTKGCEAKVSNHSSKYSDYSTGARCCSAGGATAKSTTQN